MKKLFSGLLAILLVATMVISFAACGDEGETSGEITYVSKYKSGDGYTPITDKVSWEGINSVPVKTANMDISEARQICVDFFRYAKTALWIPNADYDIWSDATIHTDGTPPARGVKEGVVYGGLPYISWGTGSIYRLMDYVDEDTGVVDIVTGGAKPLNFGNQCANGAYVGFARVINSAKYGVTATMVQQDGFLRLGNYTYADYLGRYGEEYGTPHIIQENGDQAMYESYALLKHGDGLVYWTTAGHVIMCATDAVVVRGADGKIDPAQSYITIIDQATKFVTATSPNGDKYEYEESVDAKKTFLNLLNGKYLPFTFAEWTGADPIEETEVTYSHTGDTITLDQLFSSKITANYYIFDSYAQIFDKKGNEVVKIAIRSTKANTREMKFAKYGDAVDIWGDLEKLDPKGAYTVKIYTQLGTGERPTLWEGKLAQ